MITGYVKRKKINNKNEKYTININTTKKEILTKDNLETFYTLEGVILVILLILINILKLIKGQ